MAWVYRSQGDYTKALEYYEKSLEIRLAKLGADHPSTKKTQSNIETVKNEMK